MSDHARHSKRKSLFVVDDAQNLRDARALQQAQQLIAAGRFDAAFDVVEPLSRRPQTSIQAQATLLTAALRSVQGRADDVLTLLSRVDGLAGVVVDRGFFLMLRAQALRQRGEILPSVRDAAASCAIGATPARLLVLAGCRGAAGDVDGAVDALVEARALDDDNAVVAAQLAGWLAVKGDRDGSDAVFAEFVDVEDKDADWFRNAAFAHACRGDVDEARAAVDEAFARDPAVTRAYVDDEPAFAGFRDTLACVRADTSTGS
jgi:tetratricopeptide (TPR) repeat protein